MDVAGEAGLADLAYPVEHLVDVDLAAADRRVLGEGFHAVNQRDDAVGLVADQLGQLAAGRIGILLQQLGRAANPRERVFHLMRQHRRHCGNRTGRVAVGQLAVHLVRHRALVQRQHQEVSPLPGRRALDRHRPGGDAWALEQQIVFGDRPAGAPDRIGEREERAVRRDELCERMTDQRGGADPEKLLRRRIDEANRAAAVEHDQGIGQGGQQRPRIGQRRSCRSGRAAAPQ